MEEPTNPDFTREYKFHDPPMAIRANPRSCFFCNHCTDIFYDWNGPYGWACEKHQCTEDDEGPVEKGLLGQCQDFFETEESSEDDRRS